MEKELKEVATSLIYKHYSPLIIRKYQFQGWPLYVGIICDLSLDGLDSVVTKYLSSLNPINEIQFMRNVAGGLSERIKNHYDSLKAGCVEGVAILLYVDKLAISSLYGDFMNHFSCRFEFYSILNILPHI